MLDLSTLLFKYSCLDCKNGLSIIIYPNKNFCSISMCLNMALQAQVPLNGIFEIKLLPNNS